MVKFKRGTSFILILWLSFSFSYQADAAMATREEMLDIAKELHPPGCTDSMTADYCMLYTAHDLRAEIMDMLSLGKEKNQIIDELVQKYGERILAAPKAEGFHLLAWILPGAAILSGGSMIAVLLYVWVRRSSKTREVEAHSQQQSISTEESQQVQEQLKHWL